MKISKLSKYLKFDIIRDFEFEGVGNVDTTNSKTLVYLINSKYLSQILKNKNISGVITTNEFAEKIPNAMGLIVSNRPYYFFNDIHEILISKYSKHFSSQISQNTIIHASAIISKEDVIIKDGVLIEENVVIKRGVTINEGSIIRSNCVIGSEGFEVKKIEGKNKVLKHNGLVIIGSEVEIQSNCCVDKGLMNKNTLIGSQTKINNLCHIAHAVQIGKYCRIGAKVSISGSTIIGDDVWIGPGCNISNGLYIGNNCRITIGSTVLRDVQDGKTVTGYFAQDHRIFLKNYLKLLALF